MAEMLVASTLIALVMTTAYTAFSTQLRVWRHGDAGMEAYQDARTSLTMMSRELQSAVTRAAHLFHGDDNEFEFFAVVPPMDVEEGSDARVMWVRYRLGIVSGTKGRRLIREEAVVEDALPLEPLEGETVDLTLVKLGRKERFELARGVKDFEIGYHWLLPDEGLGPTTGETPAPRKAITVQEHEEGWGLPQGIKLDLTLLDVTAESGETTFTAFVAFRGQTTFLSSDDLDGPMRSYL